MKYRITLIIIALGLVLASSASASTCRGAVNLPGYGDHVAYIDVQVSRHIGMTCARAVRVAAAGYDAPGLRTIFDFSGRRFGGGNYGGPFHVGHLSCWLNARGSDFKDAACWAGRGRGREYVKFYDQRAYWGL